MSPMGVNLVLFSYFRRGLCKKEGHVRNIFGGLKRKFAWKGHPMAPAPCKKNNVNRNIEQGEICKMYVVKIHVVSESMIV